MPPSTKLSDIVAHNPQLRQLFREAGVYQSQDGAVKACIDEPLRSHVRFALVRDETLILVADTSVWAAKLRYQVAPIHDRVRALADFPKIRSIRVKVLPALTSAAEIEPGPMTPIGDAAAAAMKQQIECFSDQRLRDALTRLFRHR